MEDLTIKLNYNEEIAVKKIEAALSTYSDDFKRILLKKLFHKYCTDDYEISIKQVLDFIYLKGENYWGELAESISEYLPNGDINPKSIIATMEWESVRENYLDVHRFD